MFFHSNSFKLHQTYLFAVGLG